MRQIPLGAVVSRRLIDAVDSRCRSMQCVDAGHGVVQRSDLERVCRVVGAILKCIHG